MFCVVLFLTKKMFKLIGSNVVWYIFFKRLKKWLEVVKKYLEISYCAAWKHWFRCCTYLLSEPRVCHQLLQSKVMCYRSAQIFGKTGGHFVEMSCLLKRANTKKAFSALFLDWGTLGAFILLWDKHIQAEQHYSPMLVEHFYLFYTFIIF